MVPNFDVGYRHCLLETAAAPYDTDGSYWILSRNFDRPYAEHISLDGLNEK
jgi:hypothetical protein